MKHLLGIVGSIAHNIETKQEDYMVKMEVSADIIQWLDAHDVRIDPTGKKVYICNDVEYVYIGPAIVLTGEAGKA